MKKLFISFITLFILFGLSSSFASDARICETIYSVINGARYFSSIHCTEDIKLGGVVADEASLRDVSQRTINDFIISNNSSIVEFVDEGNSCEDISELEEIQEFETVIYSNNDISYTSTTSKIESLTESIEDGKEKYNEVDLYNEVFEDVKNKYPVGSIDFLRTETRQQYFDKQLEIKEDVLEDQKEKLTLLYKLSESQKFIEGFYEQINRVCDSYYETKWGDSTEEEKQKALEEDSEVEEDEEEELIAKYKEEFNKKLGEKLDAMPEQVLKQLSVKLLDYAENSPIFKRFSDSQKVIINMKIKALKEAIDDRLE